MSHIDVKFAYVIVRLRVLRVSLNYLLVYAYCLGRGFGPLGLLIWLFYIHADITSVFTNVTIGMGDDIHRRNASAPMLSWGVSPFSLYRTLYVDMLIRCAAA